jgi:hypothetical protein
MRLKDDSKKLYESAVPESESPATKRGRAAGTVEPIGTGPAEAAEEEEEEGEEEDEEDEGNSAQKRTTTRTSTGYARKPPDRIQISLTRDRIICFSRIPVSTVIADCGRASGFVAPRSSRVIYVRRGSSR